MNFARDREVDSSGEAEMEHREQDVLFVPASTSHHSRVRKFGRSGRGVRSPSLRDEVNPEVHAWCISWGHEVESARSNGNQRRTTALWKHGDGSYSFFCAECCSSDHPEVVWYHEGGCWSACPNLHPVSGELLLRLSFEKFSSLQGISASSKRRSQSGLPSNWADEFVQRPALEGECSRTRQ